MDYPVEIKTNVEREDIDAALSALRMDYDKGEPRTIYFFELPAADPGNGATIEAGPMETALAETEPMEFGPTVNRPRDADTGEPKVILRLRREEESADSTLKLRPFNSPRVPDEWRKARKGDDWEFRIEGDWSTAAPEPVLSASLVVDLDVAQADTALASGNTNTLFKDLQWKLLEAFTGRPPDLSVLRLLGPIQARKWKPELGDRKLACEEWIVGPELRFLELSDREANPKQVEHTRQHLLDLYAKAEIQVSKDPTPKTKIAMDYFRNLADNP